jgi:hypothetical protein
MNRKKLYIPSLILYIFVILSVSIFGAPLGGMTAADQSDISKLQYAASQHEIILLTWLLTLPWIDVIFRIIGLHY